MTKGQNTKIKILQQAAELFNQKGYAGSSMADVMRVTGLQKGGIYNHFASKDELAVAAFEYATSIISERQRQVLKGKRNARDRLHALIRYGCLDDEGELLVPGGCPLLNTAVEVDDTHPILKQKAQKVLQDWHSLYVRVIKLGIRKGEVLAHVNADDVATVIIATLEGVIMMSNLSGHLHYRKVAIAHLIEYIDVYCGDTG